MRVIYCGIGLPSVFDAQVLAYINYIAEENLATDIFLLWGIKDSKQYDILLSKRINAKIKLFIFKALPNYYGLNIIQRLLLFSAMMKIGFKHKKSIIHVRGEIVAYHLKMLLKYFGGTYKLLIDVRGISEEIVEFSSRHFFLKLLKVENYRRALRTLSNCKYLSTVSQSLKGYLVQNHGFRPQWITVNPCFASNNFKFDENERVSIREKLGVSVVETIVVFSSGGSAPWQNIEVLSELACHKIRIINLSDIMINAENVLNFKVDFYSMPAYLSAADYAFIWRNDSIVNKVSAPVKFSEYVCCGLPVITNYAVDSIANFIKESPSSGYLFNHISQIPFAELRPLTNGERKKLSEHGICKYGIEVVANNYTKLYRSMLENEGSR